MPKSNKEITIMRLGRQIDSNGNEHTFSAAEIDKAIEASKRIPFRVPIILTHKTPKGVADHAIADHPKSMGIVGNFRRVGNEVKGTILRGTEKFLKMVSDGVITDRSVSLYTPQAKTNPSPGTYFFRHLAALSEDSPAIKGMPDMAEELGLSESIAAFSEDPDEAYIEFSAPIPESLSNEITPAPDNASPVEETDAMSNYASTEDLNALKVQSESTQEKLGAIESSLQVTNQKLVEFMDGMKGMMATKGKTKKASSETDDEEDEEEDEAPAPKRKRSTKKVDMSETENTPPATNANLQVDLKEFEALKGKAETLETENKNLKSQVAEFQSRVEELTPKQPAPPTPQELELMARLKRHEAIIALQESEVLKNEINACLSANKERITPGMQNKATVNYTDRTYDSDTAQFNEESKTHEFELVNFMQRVATGKTDRGDYEGFKHWLSTIPSAVDLSGKSIVPNGDAARNYSDPTVPTSANYTEESIEEHNKIMSKAREIANGQKVDPGDASYQEAMQQLISQGVISGY